MPSSQILFSLVDWYSSITFCYTFLVSPRVFTFKPIYTRDHIASQSMLRYPQRNSKDASDSSNTGPPRLITPPPSTPWHVQHVVVEDKPQLDVQSLMIGLNLGRGRCGPRTKITGKPCNVPVKPEEAKVDSKLEALISLTQSLLNLRTELHELAKVVHCGHHRGDEDLRCRVDKWIIAFPPGDSKLKTYRIS